MNEWMEGGRLRSNNFWCGRGLIGSQPSKAICSVCSRTCPWNVIGNLDNLLNNASAWQSNIICLIIPQTIQQAPERLHDATRTRSPAANHTKPTASDWGEYICVERPNRKIESLKQAGRQTGYTMSLFPDFTKYALLPSTCRVSDPLNKTGLTGWQKEA